MFRSLEKLKDYGFEGFKTIQELNNSNDIIPKKPGIYLVLNSNQSNIEFLPIGTGGNYQNRKPNKDIPYLTSKWVNDAIILYIGKTGGSKYKTTLQKRLKAYLDFGLGKPVSHYGGRLIWQLKNSHNLVICWKSLIDVNPRSIEKNLILAFKAEFANKKPFANIYH